MQLDLRIALLLVGLVAIIALFLFGKSKRAVHKREDDEFNFENTDLPDPLELDQALELEDDLDEVGSLTNDTLETNESDNDPVADDLGEEISNLVREDISESPRIKIPRDKPAFSQQPSLLDEDPEPPKLEQKLVILHVMARRPQKFSGKAIANLTREYDLELDELLIFNKNVDRFSGKKAVYSIVNMVKPGTFDEQTIDEFETPGLSFILSLPGPEEGLRAFNIMLEDARKFAERLNGELLDASRNRLNPQMTAHLQEDIQLFSLKNPRPVPA